MLCFVEQVGILLLREDFLAAIALIHIVNIVSIPTSDGSIKHVDDGDARLRHDSDIVENRALALTDDKYLFVHAREELLDAVGARIVQELYELGLIDDVKE